MGEVVLKWPRIASGFSRVLPHSYGMVLPEGSPSKGWVQPEDFLVKAPQELKAFVCLFSASPEWVTEQCWQQPPWKKGSCCLLSVSKNPPVGMGLLFCCFYWNIVCVHTQAQKHTITVNFGPSFMTPSPVKTFLSACSLAEFAGKGCNSSGSIWFSKAS